MSAVTKLMTPGGGGVALTPASSIASDVTVNVPSQNCTLGIQGPAFSAYAGSGQTITSGTYTKIACNTEEFDTNSNFDSVTNYRFTPTVAGYYQVNGQVSFTTGYTYAQIAIYKNGTAFKYGMQGGAVTGQVVWVTVNSLIYCNGSTDYIELYAAQVSGGNGTTVVSSGQCYFQGALARAA